VEALLPYLEQSTYAAAFVLLLAAGVGVPIPEDIPILLSGYLSHRGVMRFEIALPVCFIGVIVGDACLFMLARHGSQSLRRHPLLARLVTAERRTRARDLVRRRGVGAVVIARHVAGLRVAVFATAGAAGMRFRRFIFWDAVSACASVPVMFTLGYLFADRLDVLVQHIHQVQHWAFAIALLVAIVALVYWQWSDRLPSWWPGSTDHDAASE
jgi:membrane protein DedA with SNARE-associated domain